MFAGLNMRAPGAPGYYREDYLTASGTRSTIVLAAVPAAYIGAGAPLTIFKNGALLFYGVDYTVAGRTVSLVVNAASGDKYLVQLVSLARPTGPSYLSGAPGSAPFADVKSQLHFDGTFTDVIAGNTWTATGGATTSTAAFKYGTASGKFVRSSVQYIDMSSTSTGNVGANDFTVECWINPSSVAGTNPNYIACKDDNSGGGQRGWILNLSGSFGGAITGTLYVSTTAYSVSSGIVPTTGAWTHVALCRVGQICTIYVGGVNKGTVSLPSPSSVIGNSAYAVRIGNPTPNAGSLYGFDGYIDDFRLTIGASQYTSNFTPTGPFPNS